MLFARDKSQMCNNLLQFAHVYAWAREHGRSVMSMRFSYKYKYFKISRSPLVSFPLYVCAKWLAALRLLPTASFKYPDCDAAALEQKMLSHRHIVVSGWYARWYDLFLKYRDEICDLFTIDPQYTHRVTEWMQQQEAEQTTPQPPSSLTPSSLTPLSATVPDGSPSGSSTDLQPLTATVPDGSPSGSSTTPPPVRLGVHIRRGDYAQWLGGRYYYSDEVYAAFISRFISLMPGQRVEVYIAANDPNLSLSSLTPPPTAPCAPPPTAPSAPPLPAPCAPPPTAPCAPPPTAPSAPPPTTSCGASPCDAHPSPRLHILRGNAVEDLYMLSQCDYIIGPPSTYSLVAAMYRDIPLCRMDQVESNALTLQHFHTFDYWFRRIL